MSENSNPLGPAPVQVEDQPLPISMSLLQFDKIVVLSECGEIYEAAYDPSFNQWDATAQCNVSLNDIKNMFAFQSDHFDVDDVSANDIRFYVDNNAIPELDLSSNLVFSGPVITADVPHNYLLHDAVDGNSNDKFNICREIFKMMVSRASSRFVDLEPLEIVDVVDGDAAKTRIDPNANNLYRLPFVPGDQLVMRVVIQPCHDQSSFLNVAQDAVIQANQRAYLFYLNLV